MSCSERSICVAGTAAVNQKISLNKSRLKFYYFIILHSRLFVCAILTSVVIAYSYSLTNKLYFRSITAKRLIWSPDCRVTRLRYAQKSPFFAQNAVTACHREGRCHFSTKLPLNVRQLLRLPLMCNDRRRRRDSETM